MSELTAYSSLRCALFCRDGIVAGGNLASNSVITYYRNSIEKHRIYCNEICTDIGVDTTDLTSDWIYVANQQRNSKSYIALESIDRFGESSDGSSRKIENSEIFGGYTSISISNNCVAAGSECGQLYIYDVQASSVIADICVDSCGLNNVLFENNQVYVTGKSLSRRAARVSSYDLRLGSSTKYYYDDQSKLDIGGCASIAITGDNNKIICGTDNGYLVSWDTRRAEKPESVSFVDNCKITTVLAFVGTGSNRFYTYLGTETGQLMKCEGGSVTTIASEHGSIQSLRHQQVSGGSVSLLLASSIGGIKCKSDI